MNKTYSIKLTESAWSALCAEMAESNNPMLMMAAVTITKQLAAEKMEEHLRKNVESILSK